MRKCILLGIMMVGFNLAVSVCAVRVCFGGEPVFSGPFGALSGDAWGDDKRYDLIAPVFALPAANSAQEPLYVIGPVDPNHPQSLFALPHDRVIPLPADGHGQFTAVWRALLVFPTDLGIHSGLVATRGSGLAYAVNFGSGFVDLTSVEKIELAEALGLVETFDPDFVFICAVVPDGVVH